MNKITTVIWVDDDISQRYVSRLSSFLNPNNAPNITTPMENKEVFANNANKANRFFRPMIVFDYDVHKEFQKCFSLSSPKINKDNPNDLIYYFLHDKSKIVLSNPLKIPTTYLQEFKFVEQISIETNGEVKHGLLILENRFHQCKRDKDSILYQYQCIKYNSDNKHKFYFKDVQNAHNKMINESKVDEFCKKELKKIKNYQLSN